MCQCGKKNYTERTDCRVCGWLRPPQSMAPAAAARRTDAATKAPTASASPEVSPSLRVKQLEQQVEALERMGAAQATIDAVKEEVLTAKRMQVSAKPLGARRDSAAARVERAKKRLAAAGDAVDEALRRQEEAHAEFEEASREFAGLAAEAARADCNIAPGSPADSALKMSRSLLETLEQHCISSGEPPEAVVMGMRELAAALQEVSPEPEVKFDLGEDKSAEDAADYGGADADDRDDGMSGGAATPARSGGEASLSSECMRPPGLQSGAAPPISAPQARAVLRAMGAVQLTDGDATKRKLEELVAIAAMSDASERPSRPAKKAALSQDL